MPGIFTDYRFYEMRGPYRDFIYPPAMRRPKKDRLYTQPRGAITPSEYGVILVDTPHKKIFSRQGYCKIGSSYISSSYGNDFGEAQCFVDAYLAGKIASFKAGFRFGKNQKREPRFKTAQECYDALVKAVQDGEELEFDAQYDFSVDTNGWTIDQKIDPAWQVWDEVLAFLKENNWKSKTRFPKQDQERLREYQEYLREKEKAKASPPEA